MIPAAIGAPMAIQAALGGAELAHAYGTEPIPPDALASRTFAYAPIIVRPAIEQAAQRDGRRIEGNRSALIVSYPASPSTGNDAGSIAVESHGRGLVTFTTTVIVRRGPLGSVEAGRRAGEQLLDAVAADLADIERRVATKKIALDVATVFDALVQVGQGQGRELLARDDTIHSLRVSVLTLGGYLDISCVASGQQHGRDLRRRRPESGGRGSKGGDHDAGCADAQARPARVNAASGSRRARARRARNAR